jgi:hypothetical protein
MFTAHVFENRQLVSGEHANVLCAYGSLPFASGQQRTIETAPASAGNPLWAPPSFRDGTRQDTSKLAGIGSLNETLTPDNAPICAGISGGVSLYPGKQRSFRGVGLGVAPLLAAGTIGVGGAIGALAAIVQNLTDDDWSDSAVFSSHARQIHAGMLAIQCVLGGCKDEMRDTQGNVICKAGTKPSCTVPDSMLVEWRGLRDGFGTFWADVADKWSVSNAQASELKNYARRFVDFYNRVAARCQNVDLPHVTPGEYEPPPPVVAEAPPWLKWTVAGLGIFGAVIVVRTFWSK